MSPSSAATSILEHDFISTAKITKKSVERLASFSKMQSSTDSDSESAQLLAKTVNKIHGLMGLLDSSIANTHICYQFATSAVILCDKTGQEGTLTKEDFIQLSSKGSKMAKEIASGFKGVDQVIYKITASTKDDTQLVVIPPGPSHPETTKKSLKDIGTDLVANLSLFTQLSRSVDEIAEWWACIESDLTSETTNLLPFSTSSDSADSAEMLALWSGVKDRIWAYYKIIDGVQVLFPDLLKSSIAAWHSAKDGQSPLSNNSQQKKPSALSKFFDFSRHDGVKKTKRKNTKGKEKETLDGQQESSKTGPISDRISDEVAEVNPSRKAKRRIPILQKCISSDTMLD